MWLHFYFCLMKQMLVIVGFTTSLWFGQNWLTPAKSLCSLLYSFFKSQQHLHGKTNWAFSVFFFLISFPLYKQWKQRWCLQNISYTVLLKQMNYKINPSWKLSQLITRMSLMDTLCGNYTSSIKLIFLFDGFQHDKDSR